MCMVREGGELKATLHPGKVMGAINTIGWGLKRGAEWGY